MMFLTINTLVRHVYRTSKKARYYYFAPYLLIFDVFNMDIASKNETYNFLIKHTKAIVWHHIHIISQHTT